MILPVVNILDHCWAEILVLPCPLLKDKFQDNPRWLTKKPEGAEVGLKIFFLMVQNISDRWMVE